MTHNIKLPIRVLTRLATAAILLFSAIGCSGIIAPPLEKPLEKRLHGVPSALNYDQPQILVDMGVQATFNPYNVFSALEQVPLTYHFYCLDMEAMPDAMDNLTEQLSLFSDADGKPYKIGAFVERIYLARMISDRSMEDPDWRGWPGFTIPGYKVFCLSCPNGGPEPGLPVHEILHNIPTINYPINEPGSSSDDPTWNPDLFSRGFINEYSMRKGEAGSEITRLIWSTCFDSDLAAETGINIGSTDNQYYYPNKQEALREFGLKYKNIGLQIKYLQDLVKEKCGK